MKMVEIENDGTEQDEFKLFKVGPVAPEPSILIPLSINGSKMSMELDTGASVSVMSNEAWRKLKTSTKLQISSLKLRTYTGEALKVVGQALVDVEYEGNTKRLPIQVLEGDGPSLLGRNWLKDIKLNWRTIKKLSNNLDSMLEEHKDVFKDELGTMKGVKAKLFVKPGSSPKFFKPRSVPHALKGAIEQELDRLECMGVMEKVRYSE